MKIPIFISPLFLIFATKGYGDEIDFEVHSGAVFKMLRELTDKTNASDSLNLPANSSSIRENITDTFSCENRTYGYYADIDNDCQIFHVCLPSQTPSGRNITYRWSFICPAETIFNQEVLVCTRPIDSIPCEDSEFYYDVNLEIGKTPKNDSKPDENQPGSNPNQPGLNPNQPGSNPNQPGSPDQPQSAYNPYDSGYQSNNNYNQPGSNNNQPGSNYNQPGSNNNQPGSGYNQPGSGYNQPGSGYNQPTKKQIQRRKPERKQNIVLEELFKEVVDKEMTENLDDFETDGEIFPDIIGKEEIMEKEQMMNNKEEMLNNKDDLERLALERSVGANRFRFKADI